MLLALETYAYAIYISVYIVYVPNDTHLDEMELNQLNNQLPKLFILFGDFNSHNYLWDTQNRQTRNYHWKK